MELGMPICPISPSHNGLAERAVQTVKQSLKKAKEGSLKTKLSRVLFQFRLTPHSTTGVSPSELMFGRQLRLPGVSPSELMFGRQLSLQLDFVAPSVR